MECISLSDVHGFPRGCLLNTNYVAREVTIKDNPGFLRKKLSPTSSIRSEKSEL